jgi:hypothetical protein
VEKTYEASADPAASEGAGLEPLFSIRLNVTDHAGRRRRGQADLLPRWPDDPVQAPCLADGHDFRLVVLSEPPAGAISPGAGVVVSAPSGPLRQSRRLQEAAVAYEAGRRPDLPIPPQSLELL